MKNTIILFNKDLSNQLSIIYDNAEIDRLQILSDNKGRSGIYLFKHKESEKFYIGSAVDLYERLRKYYISSYLKRADNYISRALLKHGHSAFSLIILEYIDIKNLSLEDTQKIILEREQKYIDSLEPVYNILKIAGSSLGYKHTVDSIKKNKYSQKGH